MPSQNTFPLRLMDANINRVLEGLRVVEDILRFHWNDFENSQHSRKLRHKIRMLLNDYYPHLIKSRSVNSHSGLLISKKQKNYENTDPKSLLLVNIKRAQEGLKVVEESCHFMKNWELAKKIEDARFQAYILEQRLHPYIINPMESEKENNYKRTVLPDGIYSITSEIHSLGRTNFEVAKEILDAGVSILQYREKGKKQREMYQECLALRTMTREVGAIFIINDYLELALAVDADGVHIGQDDLPVPIVRSLVGEKIVGVSTHSPEQAQEAVNNGADYIGVGPIFSTNTKVDVCDPVGLEYLKYVVENIKVPFVAIGGIKEHNLAQVVSCGAKTVAMVTEIVGSRDIKRKIESINGILKSKKI